MRGRNNMTLRSIIRILRTYWWFTAFLFLSITVSMVLQLAPAMILRRIIDDNFSKGILQGIWQLAFLYLLATSGSNIAEFLKVMFTTILGQHILMDLRQAMSKRLSELPIGYFTKTPAGDIMSRLTNDVDAINSMFSAGIINVITDMFKIGGLLLSLYFMAPQLFFAELAVVPIVYFCANFFRKRIFRFQKTVRSCVSDIYTFIQEWLTGIRTVKAYAIEEKGRKKFQVHLRKLFSANSGIFLYDSWFPCVMQILRAAIIAASLWLCAKNGTSLSLGLSIGTLAAVADLIARLFSPIEALATEFQTIQGSMAGIARVNEFFSQPVEQRVIEDTVIHDLDGIEITGVSFAYDGQNVLDDVNASIPMNEKSVFIGRSGAGKTTLMNIVAGLYRPKSGRVLICGVDPFTLPPQKRRQLIGIVPQMPQIFDGTIAENISLRDRSITREQIETAAKTVNIHETIMELPKGYDTVIGEGAAGMSGGEIQLLSLARAIATDPKILLLDEPTSGMDSQTEQIVFSAIRRVGEGRTIFSISHRFSGIVDADKIYLLTDGKIIESGTLDQLEAQNSWFAMYRNIEKAGWEIR